MASLKVIVVQAVYLYQMLIFAYVIASWFPRVRWVQDFKRAVTPICEPYLLIFRKLIPSAGGLDFSPVLAIIVLGLIRQFLINILW